MELFRGGNQMVKLIIDGIEYRIVKKGRLKKGDLVWDINSKSFEIPLYLEQAIFCFYMVVRKI